MKIHLINRVMTLLLLLAGTATLHAVVVIKQLYPDKMIYHTEALAVLKVELENTAEVAESVTVVFELLSDVDDAVEIARQAVTLGPKESSTVNFTWNTGHRDYGHGARVSVLEKSGKTVLDKKEEPFSITDNVWKVAMDNLASHFSFGITPQTFNDSSDGPAVKGMRAAFAEHSYYSNYYEFFAWAPDDLFELAPAGDATEMWRAGTCGFMMSRKYAHAVVQAAHDGGIQIVSYLQPFAIGRRTIEMFQKHPEWFVYDRFGQPSIGYSEENWAQVRDNNLEKMFPAGGPAGAINFTNKQALDAAIDQIVAAAKLYNFDGIRFDNTCYDVRPDQYDFTGHPLAATQQEADDKTRFALDRLRERLSREVSPNFLVGHNFGYPARYVHPAAWDRIASNGWMVMDEITGPLLSVANPGSPTGVAARPWTDLVDNLSASRDATWKLGGHYQKILWYMRDIPEAHPVDHLHPNYTSSDASWFYQNIFALACGVHRDNDPPVGRIKGYNRFATRYSALLWDNTMRPVAKPETMLTVNSAAEVWWKQFVYLRQAENGNIQTIIHLVNPPLYPMYAYRKNELPTPLEAVSVQASIPRDCAFTRAVLLIPDAAETLAPTLLEAKTEAGRVSVVVPKVELWSMVVFEWKPKEARVFATLVPPAEATKQVEINAAARQAWVESTQVKVTKEQISINDAGLYAGRVDKVEKAVDPDTRSGFALKARQGVSREWYMATGTFNTFERFGKYRVTFRVKCSDNTVTDNVINLGTVSEGGSPFENVSRGLKGTDFAAANKYQDFSLEVLRGDTGNFAYIMGYAGHADVSVDTITSERIADTTDKELVEHLGANAYKRPPKPKPARKLPTEDASIDADTHGGGEATEQNLDDKKADVPPIVPKPPTLLWVQGLFYPQDPFARAIAELKIAYKAVAVDSGTVLHDFPVDAEELAPYKTLLLSDTDPRGLGFAGRALINAWVKQGGTLIITGGPYAFGKGLTRGTLLGDIMPVETTPWDLIAGGPFTATRSTPPGCPAYNGNSGSFWIHRTTLKPGAQAMLTCNGCPLLADQQVGAGKVIVFMGTNLENETKVVPFWSDTAWNGWASKFLGAILK